MTNPTPNLSKAYAMIIERESLRVISGVSMMNEGSNATTFMTAKGGNFQNQNLRPKKNWNLQCDFYKMKGHTKDT